MFNKKIAVIMAAAIGAALVQTSAYALDAYSYDVNKDGIADLSDAAAVLNEYARISAGLQTETTCDVDGDGKVTISDAVVILDYYARKAAGSDDDTSTFSVKFIDVGQADAALVECDSHYMLIDGGNVDDSNKIYSILSGNEIDNLDIVVGTHAHEDHIGGLSGALNYAAADLVLCPVTSYESEAFTNFRSYAEQKSSGLTIPDAGDTYALGSAVITILGVNGGSNINDTSIILKVQYGDTSFLFTGDASAAAEQAVLSKEYDLSATVLKVGHHGANESSGAAWINAINPEYAIISVGANNSYGHPTDEVLSRLHDAGIKTYRTDLNGDIIAVSDGKAVSFTTDKSVSDEEIFHAGSITTTTTAIATTTVTTTIITTTTKNITAVSGNDYVVNTNSRKFHYPYCSSAAKISTTNRLDYKGTREELIARGYEPCKICKP